MRHFIPKLSVICVLATFVACTGRESHKEQGFTQIDSLTETYLMLEDTMLNSWNAIEHDENEKIIAMHDLLHTLMASGDDKKDELTSLEQRLDQLEQMRFDETGMADARVVDEYDFASNSLTTEVLALAESSPDFPKDKELQSLADKIKIAEQRIVIYRTDYDSAASQFNRFLDENKNDLSGLDEHLSQAKRPLF